jgi:NitT/TauT family transport system substrate-binding protein
MKIALKSAVLLILISILAIACSKVEPKDQTLPDLGTIKVGYLPVLSFAPLYIATDKGYFEEESLQVELLGFNSSSYMMPLLATGDLDIGNGQPGTELFNAIKQGLDIKIVGPSSGQKAGYANAPFLVRKDLFDSGRITQPADLKGGTIATNVERGLIEFITASILEMGGLTIDDVHLVSMPFSDMNVAFANQAIDAALVPEPLASMAVQGGDAVVLIQLYDVFKEPNLSVYFFGKRLLQPENREVGIRFFEAYMKAVRELNTEAGYNDQNVEIISKYINIPPETISKGLYYYFDPNGYLDPTFVEKAMTYYLSRGYTDFTEPLDSAQLFDFSFLEEALQRIGPYEEQK